MSYLINFVLFQLAWFAGILGAAHRQAFIGILVMVLCGVIHLRSLPRASRRAEYVLMFQCFCLGTLIDTVLMHAGIMVYASPNPIGFISPLWMSLLWVALAMTLNHSLAWLKNKYWLSAILGSIAGPLSYLAGIRLDAGSMPHENYSLATLSIVWALTMPLIMFLSQKSLKKSYEI
jgi:hypothetical protein